MTVAEALDEMDRVGEALTWHARHWRIARTDVIDQLHLRQQAAEAVLREHVA